jgi:hypothetical protein
MHRQVASLLSTRSPGRLAKLGSALGARGIDIATTGGAEWKHSGPVTLMLKEDWGSDPDNQLYAFAEVMADQELPWLVFRTIEIEMRDEPGALGAAATALGDVNIYAVTLLETQNSRSVVGLGVRPSQVGVALERLKAAKFHVRRRHHPRDKDEADDWWDEWDTRTEELLPHFDDPDVLPNDARFYVLKGRNGQ